MKVILQACLSTAWAAGTPEDAPFDPGYFAPTPHQLGLLYANPENATCEVLISITELNTTGPSQHQATASPVASSVTSNLTMQIENLLETEYEVRITSCLILQQCSRNESSLPPFAKAIHYHKICLKHIQTVDLVCDSPEPALYKCSLKTSVEQHAYLRTAVDLETSCLERVLGDVAKSIGCKV